MGQPAEFEQKRRKTLCCSVAKFDAMIEKRRDYGALMMRVIYGSRLWDKGWKKTLPPLDPCPSFVTAFCDAAKKAKELWGKGSPDGGAD